MVTGSAVQMRRVFKYAGVGITEKVTLKTCKRLLPHPTQISVEITFQAKDKVPRVKTLCVGGAVRLLWKLDRSE